MKKRTIKVSEKWRGKSANPLVADSPPNYSVLPASNSKFRSGGLKLISENIR